MNTISTKIIFLIFSIFIFLYSCSYARYEITKKNNIQGGILIFIFSLFSIIFSNTVFFVS